MNEERAFKQHGPGNADAECPCGKTDNCRPMAEAHAHNNSRWCIYSTAEASGAVFVYYN